MSENLAGPRLHPKVVTDGGPWADHNMPCAVCWSRAAVLNLNDGVFEPCWECQRTGFKLKRPSRRQWRKYRRAADHTERNDER